MTSQSLATPHGGNPPVASLQHTLTDVAVLEPFFVAEENDIPLYAGAVAEDVIMQPDPSAREGQTPALTLHAQRSASEAAVIVGQELRHAAAKIAVPSGEFFHGEDSVILRMDSAADRPDSTPSELDETLTVRESLSEGAGEIFESMPEVSRADASYLVGPSEAPAAAHGQHTSPFEQSQPSDRVHSGRASPTITAAAQENYHFPYAIELSLEDELWLRRWRHLKSLPLTNALMKEREVLGTSLADVLAGEVPPDDREDYDHIIVWLIYHAALTLGKAETSADLKRPYSTLDIAQRISDAYLVDDGATLLRASQGLQSR